MVPSCKDERGVRDCVTARHQLSCEVVACDGPQLRVAERVVGLVRALHAERASETNDLVRQRVLATTEVRERFAKRIEVRRDREERQPSPRRITTRVRDRQRSVANPNERLCDELVEFQSNVSVRTLSSMRTFDRGEFACRVFVMTGFDPATNGLRKRRRS